MTEVNLELQISISLWGFCCCCYCPPPPHFRAEGAEYEVPRLGAESKL